MNHLAGVPVEDLRVGDKVIGEDGKTVEGVILNFGYALPISYGVNESFVSFEIHQIIMGKRTVINLNVAEIKALADYIRSKDLTI